MKSRNNINGLVKKNELSIAYYSLPRIPQDIKTRFRTRFMKLMGWTSTVTFYSKMVRQLTPAEVEMVRKVSVELNREISEILQ